VNSNIVISFHLDIRARTRDYWATAEQFLTSFYGNIVKCDPIFSHSCFLYYRDNNAEIDTKADNCDRLWKVRSIFVTLNDAYENYYNSSEHLSADEIILKFKGKVVMWDWILECFKEYHTSGRSTYITRGRRLYIYIYIYIKQITAHNPLNFTVFKNNYWGLCVRSY
jgi:hypothetical protein